MEEADYVIVGGGTAALVVACRLSEKPDTRIVVLERGEDVSSDARVQDSLAYESLVGSEMDWNLKVAPQAGLNGREFNQPAGKALGGSSMINGCVFLPPAAAVLNAWDSLGNPGWNWDTLAPYFQRAYTLHPRTGVPNPAGPIQVSYPVSTQREDTTLLDAWKQAFEEHGYTYADELVSDGATIGTRPYTATVDPVSGHRSSAASAYGAILASRANVRIVTGATVTRIRFDSSAPNDNPTATGVEVQTEAGGTILFKPTQEVIMAAGVFNTPKILELSGIGDQTRLQQLGIPPLIHLPGVGENLTNHAMSILTAPVKAHADMQGLTPGMKANALIRLAPADMHDILDQARESPDHPAIAGILNDSNQASACVHFAIYPGNLAVIGLFPSFPFSRGSVHIQSADPASSSQIDPKYLTNPSDHDSMIRHVQHLQEILRSTQLLPFVDAPPPHDREVLAQLVREAMAVPVAHPCGTTAMLPREKGGVVGPDLKVYGVSNVRVVDASIFPLIPQANPISTVYTVAERAADLIRAS
ncbi:choline dehydrogenase [Aspergillus steynii IBT 23096]|uniref:Choline dehydrogenase n=1 Tax=Aspergillus steynii IBT 23096 TaxID=1392250 RepID=A0A2I2G7E7_9EURO|nr:choline dehydrogenase [Aspergillus steynii IBT 23096]PLB48800.1 choline dehydrogenase [Aspergillus steynii IBT 23096]